MLFHKACHPNGLDTKIYRHCNNKFENDYYLYIWDYCDKSKVITPDFFHVKCNIDNTWNYGLKHEDTTKENIVKDSPNYGFGNYNITEYTNESYIVKAISHIYAKETKKAGECHLINKTDIGKIDTTKFIIQPILTNNKGEELNIFVFKNLNTKEILLSSIMVSHDINKNINRKYNKCNYKFCDLLTVFGIENINNFKKYCKNINFDYGRIELINDITRGWCVIDINNSPGGGPLTEMLVDIYKIAFNSLK